MTRKGQITIPAEVRRALGLSEGDQIEVQYDEVAKVATFLSPSPIVERTAGIFKPKRPVPTDIHDIVDEEKRRAREGMADAAIERDRRSRGG